MQMRHFFKRDNNTNRRKPTLSGHSSQHEKRSDIRSDIKSDLKTYYDGNEIYDDELDLDLESEEETNSVPSINI